MTKIVINVFVVGAMVFAIVLFAMSSRSVLYRYIEAGNPIREPAFAVFNPFRDRGAERSAESFMRLIQGGDCKAAMSTLSHSFDYTQTICEREKSYVLLSWSLRNRTDGPESVKLYYAVTRSSGSEGNLWMELKKQGAEWKVIDYSAWY